MVCSYRFKDMSADHGSVAKELERANEEFKEFERKDIKYREDLKHVKAKLRKLQDKLTKDSSKMEVGLLLNKLPLQLLLLLAHVPLVIIPAAVASHIRQWCMETQSMSLISIPVISWLCESLYRSCGQTPQGNCKQ